MLLPWLGLVSLVAVHLGASLWALQRYPSAYLPVVVVTPDADPPGCWHVASSALGWLLRHKQSATCLNV